MQPSNEQFQKFLREWQDLIMQSRDMDLIVTCNHCGCCGQIGQRCDLCGRII